MESAAAQASPGPAEAVSAAPEPAAGTASEPGAARVGHGSHWPISVLSTLSSLVNMLMPLCLVRLLTPAEIGAFKVFFLYLSIVPAFSFTVGILNGLAYWAGRADRRGPAFRMSSLLVLLLAAVFGAGALVASKPLSAWLGWPAAQTVVLAIGVFGTIASAFFEEAIVSSGRVWTGAIFTSGFDLVRTAAILGAAFAFKTLHAVLLAHVVLQVAKTVAGYVLGYRHRLVGFAWDRQAFREVWEYALPVSISWVLGVFINNGDQLILSAQLSTTDFAFYAVGCLSVPPLLILEHSVARVLIPQLSEAFFTGDSAQAARSYRRAVQELALILVPATTGMIVFSGPIIALLFTHAYDSAAGYLRVFAATYLPLIVPYDSTARAKGQSRWIMGNFTCSSIASLALCFAGARLWGAYGALGGAVVARFGVRVYAIRYIGRDTGWRLSEFLPLRDFAIFTAVAAALGGGCLALRPLFHSELAWFLGAGAGFTAAYFGIVLGGRASLRQKLLRWVGRGAR